MQAHKPMVAPTAHFEFVTVETPRVNKGQVLVSLKRVLEEENLEMGQSVKFSESKGPFVVGRVHGERLDGRSHELARQIYNPGEDIVVQVPPTALEHMDVSVDEVADRDVEFYVWVVRDTEEDAPLIALSPPVRHSMELPIGDLGNSGDDYDAVLEVSKGGLTWRWEDDHETRSKPAEDTYESLLKRARLRADTGEFEDGDVVAHVWVDDGGRLEDVAWARGDKTDE